MKRMMVIVAAAASSVLLASCVVPYQKNAEPPKTITVHGKGTATAVANVASITFTVVTQEWIAKTATDSNAVITKQVYEAIKGAGVGADDISTSDINIYRQDTYANGRSFPGRYRVSNNIVVRIRNVNKASEVIDAAVAAGANEISGLTFSIGDRTAMLREARTKAIKDAEETAALLAGASGCKIGEVMMIREGDGMGDSPLRGTAGTVNEMAKADIAATPVKAGEVTVTSSVTVMYLLQ